MCLPQIHIANTPVLQTLALETMRHLKRIQEDVSFGNDSHATGSCNPQLSYVSTRQTNHPANTPSPRHQRFCPRKVGLLRGNPTDLLKKLKKLAASFCTRDLTYFKVRQKSKLKAQHPATMLEARAAPGAHEESKRRSGDTRVTGEFKIQGHSGACWRCNPS